MRRVLVVTWALGTASGVLLGLFGVHLVSSRFSTSRTSPLSHPEVLSALQAARAASVTPEEIALPAAPSPDTADPPPSPPVDAAPARPSAGATSSPAPTSPASSLPRPGATAGSQADTAVAAAVPPTTATATAPPEPSSTTTTARPTTTTKAKSDSRKGRGPSTTTTAEKTTTTSRPSPKPSHSDGIKSIESPGGDVWVKFADGKVRYQMARPDNGYSVHVWDYGTERVIVEFVSGDKRYFVRAYYNGDRPDWDVTRCTGKSYRNMTCR